MGREVLRSRAMDAPEALADLMEISSQVDTAVISGPDGDVLASTLPEEAARRLAQTAAALAGAAPDSGERTLTQLEAATRDGSVFVVRDGDRSIAATTGASPTAGLVFYDLKTCLRLLESREDAQAKGRARKKAEDGAAA
jgi:predicted regulator of Ras-like GTPase activity (Roadblock/LC7/MglB family)